MLLKCGTFSIIMTTSKLFAIVRQSVIVPRTSGEFGLVCIKPIAIREENSKWVANEEHTKLAISLYDAHKYASLLRVNNSVIITLEYHEAGVTTYVTKDKVEKTHGETGWYVSDVEQAIYIDVDEVRSDMNIDKYIPSIIRGIDSVSIANIKTSLF